MNERIKENWEKATGSAIPGPGFFASASDYNIEKFAELIVRECLNQCYNRGMDDELYTGQLKAATYIEEHFGINTRT